MEFFHVISLICRDDLGTEFMGGMGLGGIGGWHGWTRARISKH